MGTKRKGNKVGGKKKAGDTIADPTQPNAATTVSTIPANKKQRRAAPEPPPGSEPSDTVTAHSNAPSAAVRAPTKTKRGRKPLPKSTNAADESSPAIPVASTTPEIIAATASTSPPPRLRDEEDDEDPLFSYEDPTTTNLEDDVELLPLDAPIESAAPSLAELKEFYENFTPRWAIALEKKLDVFSNRIAAVEQAVLKISNPPSA